MISIKKFLVCAILLFYIKGYTQITAKNAVFIEFLGNTGSLSINYDRILIQRKVVKLCANVGAGYLPFISGARREAGWVMYGYAGSFNALIGKKKHYFEVGAGVTYNVGINALFINGKAVESKGLFFCTKNRL